MKFFKEENKMKLKDLKGIVCDYVELSWKDNGGFITHEFDDMSAEDMDDMYSKYGDANVLTIYALHEDNERSWLYIEIEKPTVRITNPVTLYIEKYTGETEQGIPMISRYSLIVDERAHEFLLNNMDCQAESIVKIKGGVEMSKTYSIRYKEEVRKN